MGRLKKVGKVEPVQKTWLSAKEAMDFLGCGIDFLRDIRNSAEVSFAQYGNKMIWYELRSLERFIEKNRVV